MNPLKLIYVLLLATLLHAGISRAAVVASFDDLPIPPDLTSSSGLQYTNPNTNLLYQGIAWDDAFSLVGDQYWVDPFGGPLFGLPHSGHYFATNQDGLSGVDSVQVCSFS